VNRIKKVLRQKGITQKELASRMNISEAMVSYSINGNPTLNTLYEIAKALDVNVSSLIEESQSEFVSCPYCGRKIKVSKE